MGFLLMISRKIQLEERKNNLEFQMTTLNSKISDLTSYASILAQDSVSLSDIASLPPSLFSQGMLDLTNSHLQAQQIAQMQFGQAMSAGLFGQGDNIFVQQITQQKMYENARKQIQKQLQARMNEEEKSIKAQQTRLQAQIDLTQNELDKVSQQAGKDAENAVCGFGLRG